MYGDPSSIATIAATAYMGVAATVAKDEAAVAAVVVPQDLVAATIATAKTCADALAQDDFANVRPPLLPRKAMLLRLACVMSSPVLPLRPPLESNVHHTGSDNHNSMPPNVRAALLHEATTAMANHHAQAVFV